MTVPAAAHWTPERIARRSGSSFLVSFAAADPERRRGLTAIYAFCRVVDDAVDDRRAAAVARSHLAYWAADLERAAGGEEPHTEVGRAIQRTARRFGPATIPRHLRDVVAGVQWDLDGTVIRTTADLERYCGLVACAVGLACLPVFGAVDPAAPRYAAELGHALQLTNILRDLRADAEAGRVYVPRDLLDAHGVAPEWLAGRGPPEAYRAGGPVDSVVSWLAARARSRFAAAEAALPAADRARLLPAAVMAAVYGELLERLVPIGAGVCRRRRVRVPSWRKLLIARRVRRRALAGAP